VSNAHFNGAKEREADEIHFTAGQPLINFTALFAGQEQNFLIYGQTVY
jgi:hypothetical protein